MNGIIAIVGPTGIGKSGLAIRLAQEYDGEIINADSRQVYRFLDIGTAKPTNEELFLVPHHIINIVNPEENFSLAQYQEMAFASVEDIFQRNKLPFLVGGSGLYIWSVLEGWGIPRVPPDFEFRKDLEEKVTAGASKELYQKLEDIDPIAAQGIDPRNVRRVIRALEINKSRGNLATARKMEKQFKYDTLIIGLTMEREELYRRIDARVDEMIERGFTSEVERLLKRGYSVNTSAMSGIGYQEIDMFLNGKLTLATATQQIKYETHRFVRQQYNWFRLNDSRIQWFDVQRDYYPKVKLLVDQFIGNSHEIRKVTGSR